MQDNLWFSELIKRWFGTGSHTCRQLRDAYECDKKNKKTNKRQQQKNKADVYGYVTRTSETKRLTQNNKAYGNKGENKFLNYNKHMKSIATSV